MRHGREGERNREGDVYAYIYIYIYASRQKAISPEIGPQIKSQWVRGYVVHHITLPIDS